MDDEIIDPEVLDAMLPPIEDLVPVSVPEAALLSPEQVEDRVEVLVQGIQARAFELTVEDEMIIEDATALSVTDADDFKRGYVLLASLSDLIDRVTAHHKPYKKPLNRLVTVVRTMESDVSRPVQEVKDRLSRRLGEWKTAEERRAKMEAEERQRVADAAARAAQQEQAQIFARSAAAEPDQHLKKLLEEQAVAVATATVRAAPVQVESNVPNVAGHTRETQKAVVTDLKALLRAWLDGKCPPLPEADIIAGLQSFLNSQVKANGDKISFLYPGVGYEKDTKAISVRRQTTTTRRIAK